jgi:hypothetical protein
MGTQDARIFRARILFFLARFGQTPSAEPEADASYECASLILLHEFVRGYDTWNFQAWMINRSKPV